VNTIDDLMARQAAACKRAGVEPAFLARKDRIGIGRDFDPTRRPINGLRHPPHGDMCGWYIWSGEELSGEPDYFEVMCYEHLLEEAGDWVEYLALPAGWRFLADAGYEDLWLDEALLHIDEP
jgi:hypothetical protein